MVGTTLVLALIGASVAATVVVAPISWSMLILGGAASVSLASWVVLVLGVGV